MVCQRISQPFLDIVVTGQGLVPAVSFLSPVSSVTSGNKVIELGAPLAASCWTWFERG